MASTSSLHTRVEGAGGDETSARLLDAAERLFAVKGYASTSVRDITQAAGCNVASVNYHYGSKHQLYECVFERIVQELVVYRLNAIAGVIDRAEAAGDLELLLRTFSEAFYRPLLDPDRGHLLFMIFMRELTDTQLEPGVLAEKMVRPTQGAMVDALMRVVPGLGEMKSLVCFRLLVGQLVHLVQIWTMATRLGDRELAPFDAGEMVDHIVRFTIGGIGAYQDDSGSEGKR